MGMLTGILERRQFIEDSDEDDEEEDDWDSDDDESVQSLIVTPQVDRGIIQKDEHMDIVLDDFGSNLDALKDKSAEISAMMEEQALYIDELESKMEIAPIIKEKVEIKIEQQDEDEDKRIPSSDEDSGTESAESDESSSRTATKEK